MSCSSDDEDEKPESIPAGNGGSPQAAPSDRPDSHQQMVSVLRQIAVASKRTHPLLGDRKAHQLRLEVAKLGPGSDPFQVVFLHSELGQAELNLDNIDEALRHLEIARTGFAKVSHPDPDVRRRFRNRLLFTLGTAYI
ncbi:MAG: hypothetical protein H8E37_00215, partial [Planctomycetes bacterium]|nr:hypothetical protein [Planctomycetota bacterium]